MRRVVTGQTVSGKSVFVSDEQIEPIRLSLMPGLEFARVWGGDDTALPADGTPPAAPAFFPPERGYRFVFVTIPPEGSGGLPEDLDLEGALAEVNEKLPGMLEHNELENPGMHTTDTVDLDLVLSGEMDLELDDGAEVHLRPGDCVVQNGTRHAWRNKSDKPVKMAFVIIGARRDA